MENDHENNRNQSFFYGLVLAISSSVFIGSSFIIKKIALRKTNAAGNLRPSAGGYSYLKQWLWWLGLSTMGIGEAANVLAYGLAPAALVTPLGALSIPITAILSSKFLDEKLNLIGKIGCVLCMIGSTIIVLHSPKTEEIKSFSELLYHIKDTVFVTYVLFILLLSYTVKAVIVPKHGDNNVFVYLFLCSAIGSLTVVFCKAVALGIKETISGNVNNFLNYHLWLLIAFSVLCIIIQMNYLNKSLDIFNTSIVTPVYYVIFTILVLVASGLLFKEWSNLSGNDIVGSICGFLVVIIALVLLNMFKDFNFSIDDINLNTRRRRLSTIVANLDT